MFYSSLCRTVQHGDPSFSRSPNHWGLPDVQKEREGARKLAELTGPSVYYARYVEVGTLTGDAH
jgi:hypothetical protein